MPYIESFDVQEYSKFIEPGSCTIRKLIIWRLCNHPRLNEFYNYSLDELNSLQAINPDPDIKRRITILNECGLLIKRIEPKYDWDQNYLIPKTALSAIVDQGTNNTFSVETQAQSTQSDKTIKYMNSNKKFDDFLEDILWEMTNKGWKVSEMEGYSFEREYIELRIKDVVIFFLEEFSSEMNYEGILVSRVYHQLYNKLLEIKNVITDPIRTFSMGSINTQIATSLGYDKPELEIEIPIIDADYEAFREKLLEYFDKLYKTFDTKWMSLPMFLQNIVDVPLSKLDKEYTVGYMYKVISSSILDDERLERFKQEAKDYVEQIGEGKLEEYQLILKTLNI